MNYMKPLELLFCCLHILLGKMCLASELLFCSPHRNGSVIADYQLTFLMPEEQQDQLRNFTLSREMVYSVFRQFLYDQETDEPGLMYIDPLSLNMFLRH